MLGALWTRRGGGYVKVIMEEKGLPTISGDHGGEGDRTTLGTSWRRRGTASGASLKRGGLRQGHHVGDEDYFRGTVEDRGAISGASLRRGGLHQGHHGGEGDYVRGIM